MRVRLDELLGRDVDSCLVISFFQMTEYRQNKCLLTNARGKMSA